MFGNLPGNDEPLLLLPSLVVTQLSVSVLDYNNSIASISNLGHCVPLYHFYLSDFDIDGRTEPCESISGYYGRRLQSCLNSSIT